MANVLFLNVGWARAYRGDADDLPRGQFRYLAAGNTDVGEAFNFKVYRGKCYGYSPAIGGTINIEALGASREDDRVEEVLVVWMAANPDRGGSFIVGWWRNATVYRHLQKIRPQPGCPECVAIAKAADCRLLSPDERTYPIRRMAKGWPGQSSVFFASRSMAQGDLASIVRYVDGERPSPAVLEEKVPSQEKGWPVLNTELRARIEQAAVATVRSHYEALKARWVVTSVEKESFGWDLEARSAERLLRIEVKGRAFEGPVELTPNEYRAMQAKMTRSSYRLAIVYRALERSPALRIFAYSARSEQRVDEDGAALRLDEKVGAVATVG